MAVWTSRAARVGGSLGQIAHVTQVITIAAVLIGLVFGAGCASSNMRTPFEGFLTLSYYEFDQTPRSGWRVLAEDDKRYVEAARLIEKYLDLHSDLDRFQRATLHWHAAQLLAMAGDVKAALQQLPFARLDPEPPNSPVRWNDYVDATAAFLEGDRARLQAARDRIATNSPGDANLPVVDSLLVHFEAPYARAYRATR